MSLRLGSVIALVLILGSTAFSADWPQWRGPNRDAKVAGFEAPKTWPKELSQKWKAPIGDGVATPALVGDKLYVFARQDGKEILRCLDAASGKEVWKDGYEADPAKGPAASFPGPRSSPAVADGKVVTLGVQGTLSCYNAASGKLDWRKEDYKGKSPMFFTSCSPIIVDGLCIVQLGGDQNGAIVAYELGDGKEKWKWTGDGTAYSSPVLDNVDGAKVIVAETAKNMVAVSAADGKLLWQTSFPAAQRQYNACTPVVQGATVIFSGAGRGTKAVKLEKQGDGFTGKELWSNADNAVQFNSPVLKNGLVFGLTGRDQLFCINAESGKTAWTAAAPKGTTAPPAAAGGGAGGGGGGGRGMRGQPGYGSIVDAGSVLFALTPSGLLVVFEPSDKEFKQIASYKVADGDTYAYPVITDKRIFIKDKETVTLWTID